MQIILKYFSYNILCKGLTNSKTLHIRFDKIDGFIRVYDGTRYLVLFGSKKYDSNYNMIRYLMCKKWDYIYNLSKLCKNQIKFIPWLTNRKDINFSWCL